MLIHSPSGDVSDGWIRHVHPEGLVYFQNPEKQILTPNDPRDPHVESLFDVAWQRVVDLGVLIEIASTDIYLNLSLLTGEVEYYLADHHLRVPFWVEPVDVRTLGLAPYGSQDALSE